MQPTPTQIRTALLELIGTDAPVEWKTIVATLSARYDFGTKFGLAVRPVLQRCMSEGILTRTGEGDDRVMRELYIRLK